MTTLNSSGARMMDHYVQLPKSCSMGTRQYHLASVRSSLGTYVQLPRHVAAMDSQQASDGTDAVAASPELGGPAVVSP